METAFSDLKIIGTYRSFGIGPVYEILEAVKRLDNGDWLMKIKLVETGEITEYKYSSILNDPVAV